MTPAPRAQVIAHRGSSAAAPEHTIAAYDLAVAQGADMIELDVRATADRALVVVHDRTLHRTAGDPRAVAALTRADLAQLPEERRPLTLEAVLDRYGGRVGVLVELKDPDASWEHRVAEHVALRGLEDEVVVQSFDHHALHRLAVASPWLRVASLHRTPPTVRTLDRLARFASGVGVRHELLTARTVAAAHARGLAVRAWTVNGPGAIGHVVGLGADGVITDVPDVAREVVALRGAQAAAA